MKLCLWDAIRQLGTPAPVLKATIKCAPRHDTKSLPPRGEPLSPYPLPIEMATA